MTKTLRKRIALVAVSAVGFGLLSTISASATETGPEVQLGTGASTSGYAEINEGRSVGYIASSASSSTSGTVTGTILPNAALSFYVDNASSTYTSAVISGGSVTTGYYWDSAWYPYSVYSDSGDASVSSDLSNVVSYDSNNWMEFAVKPTVPVGSQMTVTFYKSDSRITNDNATRGTLYTRYVFTVAAAGSTNVVSTAKSKLIVDDADNYFGSSVDRAGGFAVANGGTGYITAWAADAYGVALSGSHLISASATNGAKVILSENGSYPTKSTDAYIGSFPWSDTPGSYIGVYVTQGTANAAVTTDVSVSVDGVSIGTKTLAFVGDIAKLTVTVAAVAKKGESSNVAAVYKAYDSAGNRVDASASIKATNSVIPSATVTGTTSSASGLVKPNCADYGTNSNLYLEVTNEAGVAIDSPVFSLSCAGDMYTYTAKLDKTSYKQGEIATLTITGLDVKGKPSNDIVPIGTSDFKPAISGAYMTAVNSPLYSDLTSNGVITYQFIVGNTAGTYSMAVDLPLLTNPAANATDTAKTVGYTIASSGGASLETVLAAIVKLIASINKQIAALQKALKK